MTELQGTVESVEVAPVTATGKKVLNESSNTMKESTKPSLKSIFSSLLSEAEQVTIQPAKQNTQVIKQGQKTLGTVENPQLAQQIKQSIGKGEMSLAGDELNEVEDEIDSAEYEADVYDGDDYDDDDGSDQYATELNGLHLGDVVKAYYNGKAVIGKINELYPTYMEVELELTGRNTGKTIVVDVRDIDDDNLNETDMGQADARKSTPSSKEEQEKVFSKSRERSRNLRAELDADPELLTRKNTKKVDESKLTEKAVSKVQQQAAGAALAAKRGDAPKSKLKGASKEMAKMPAKELEKFAKTKHKGLPEKKKTDEAAMPTHDGDFGAGLGAGRNSKTLESKKAKPDFLDLDKDGNKKESMKKAAADATKKVAVKEGRHPKAKVEKRLGKYAVIDDGKVVKTFIAKYEADEHANYLNDKKAAADKQKVSTMKKTNEAKAKPDFLDLDKDGDKKESMKKAAADKKTGSADKKSSAVLTAAQKKLPAGLQKAVAKKKTVKEGANPTEAARLLGKAHAMGKDPFACKYEAGTPEAQAYLDGYKEGLDECYGSGGGMGMQQDIGMMPGMNSMVSMNDAPSLRGGSEFEVDSMDDMGSFGGFDSQSDDTDMMAFEAWDRELNALLNEGKMKDIDIDMKQMSDAQFKKEHGKSKADMKKDLSSDSKKPVKEGISVSVSKGQQGAPDSVTVSAQDSDADALLAMIKQAGLGLFGGDEPSGYGSPAVATQPVGDHDSMMDLIKKMSSTGNDYEDEESQDDQHVHGHPDAACDVCGSGDCGCNDESDSKALVVGEEQGYDDKEDESLGMRTGKESDKEQSMKDRRDDSYGKFGKRTDEDETEDQMEFEVAESNAPDSDEAETTADENAEAKEDQALAGAMSGNEEEIDEGSCSMDEEEELTEWANDAGYEGSENTKDNTFEQDIEFMTRVISGGLNGPKKDQTTLPHTRVKVDESRQAINDWKKLSGIK